MVTRDIESEPLQAHEDGVTVRLIATPCCSHQMTWIGSRLPNYCPECGAFILTALRTVGGLTQCILLTDSDATLVIHG